MEKNLTKRERKELRRQEKMNEQTNLERTAKKRNWTILIGIVLLLGIAVFGFSKLSNNQVATTSKTVDDTISSNELLTVNQSDWVKGNKEASVVLVEYLDFECEACGAYFPLVKQLSEEYKNDVLFVSRYFPLPGHKNGLTAALAVEAASKQGKYWEMYDLLFEKQQEWGEKQAPDPSIFEKYAATIGLDIEKFKQDVKSDEVKQRVNKDRESGIKLGVQGTPSFFLNGEKIPNPKSAEDFKTLIQAAILKAPKNVKTGQKVHDHADIKVYLANKKLDLSQPKYQSTEEKELDDDTHMHDGNGDVVHKHRTGITIGYFFKTLGITFDNKCFALDTGEKYCSDEKNKLAFYVNGKLNDKFGDYEFSDLDRLLITYGENSDEIVKNQISSVTDLACMYSEKCPERGKPPTEKCVGGLGDDC